MVDVVSEDLIDLDNVEKKAEESLYTHTPYEIQQNLIKLAPIFARTISEDNGFKELLAKEVGKKFDGDNDVLYDMISSKMTKEGKTLEKLLNKNVQLCTDNVTLNELVDSIPYFNISIPVCFEQWNTYDGPIYVIPMRYDIDDIEIEALEGFDENGNSKMFPAETPPEFPVVVIGINERMNIMKQKKVMPNVEPLEYNGELTIHYETLEGILLFETLEPWYSGNPEVYCLYTVGENEWALRQSYTMVDLANKWYNFGWVIFHYGDSPNNMFWKLVVREEDFDWGDYVNFTVKGGFTWKNETYNIQGDFSTDNLITNEDDTYGETQIFFYHDLGTKNYSQICFGKGLIRLGY